MKLKKYAANILTSIRILASVLLVPVEVLTKEFFVVYIIAGLTDVLDGTVARLTNSVSEFGSKLDSIADLLFYTVMMVKMYPCIKELLPKYMWVLIMLIIVIRICMYAYVRLTDHTIMHNHTWPNKLTGFLVFLIPFVIKSRYFVYFGAFVILVAIMSIVYELGYMASNKKRRT